MIVRKAAKPGQVPMPAEALDLRDRAVAEAVLQERLRRAQIADKRLLEKAPVALPQSRHEFYLQRLHPKQRAAVEDTAKQKVFCVASRGGKTTALILYGALVAEQFPGAVIPYVVPEGKSHAADMFMRPFIRINEELQLGLDIKESEKLIGFSNGAIIRLLGAHDQGAEARLRGIPFPLALLDECKDFGDRLGVLLREAIIPRMDDYGGTVVCAGTPGNQLDGMFYEISRRDKHRNLGWSAHYWGRQDNHHLKPQKPGDVDPRDVYAIAKARGIDITSGYFKREYLGEWAPDEAELAYPYDVRRNGWAGQLDFGYVWSFCIACDFGETDDYAYCVVAFRDGDPNLYFVETFNQNGMTHDAQCLKSKEVLEKYQALGRVVEFRGDSGGYGKSLVTSIQQKYGLPMQPVEKKPGYKAGAIAEMRSDFMLGRIQAVDDTPLTREWARVNKDPKTGETDHTDLGDAGLYAHKHALHWLTPQGAEPAKTMPAWQAREAAAIKKLSEDRQTHWWDKAPSEVG